MAKVRQLPKLHIRGSLATQTMTNLTEEEKAKLDDKLEFLLQQPELQTHKSKIIKELGITIGADYADDFSSAEQEFNIAVWRGLVNIYYHRDYTYHCKHCQQSVYFTKRGRPKVFEKQDTPCLNCRHAEVSDPGDTELKIGDIVNHDLAQEEYKSLSRTPTFKSCLTAIAGDKKYNDPDEIINCPKQRRKFFGEFVWNYFRQQIKENKITVNKQATVISDSADKILKESLLNVCAKYHVHFTTNESNSEFTIYLSGLCTQPEFSLEIAAAISEAVLFGVRCQVQHNMVTVCYDNGLPFVSTTVIKPERIMLVDPSDNTSNSFDINQVDKGQGISFMNQDDHVEYIDMNDAYRRTRNALPDGPCRLIFDIYSQVGSTYDEYVESFGEGTPRTNHIARFLRLTPRVVKQYKETIQVCCLANDFIPSKV